jgi:hypothetical protein
MRLVSDRVKARSRLAANLSWMLICLTVIRSSDLR